MKYSSIGSPYRTIDIVARFSGSCLKNEGIITLQGMTRVTFSRYVSLRLLSILHDSCRVIHKRKDAFPPDLNARCFPGDETKMRRPFRLLEIQPPAVSLRVRPTFALLSVDSRKYPKHLGVSFTRCPSTSRH